MRLFKPECLFSLCFDSRITSEIVATRYGISREAQDEFAFQSQQKYLFLYSLSKFEVDWADSNFK